MTSIAPEWLRLVGGPRSGRFELIEDRAAIVRSIFADTISGLGRRMIVRSLNERGVETWGRGGKKGVRWHDSYVQKILNNPAVFGRFEPLSKRSGGNGVGSITLDNYYPPVIDEATFYRAQAASQSRGAGRGRVDRENGNLLRGLVRCRCGATLIKINKGRRSSGPRLICGSAHAAAGCTDRTYYRYRYLEAGVIWAIGNRRSELIAGSENKAVALAADRAALAARRDDVERRLNNLVELVAAGGGGAAVAQQVAGLQAGLDEIEPALQRLDAEIAAATGQSAAGGDDLLAVYRTLSTASTGDDARRARALAAQRLRELVDRIEIQPGQARVVMVDGGVGYVEGGF